MEFEEVLEILSQLLHMRDVAFYGISSGVSVIFAFIAIFNLIQCFFGFRLFKLMTTIAGVLIGFVLGSLGFAVTRYGAPILSVIGLTLLIALPILGGMIAYRVYQIGVFIYAGFVPGLIAALLSLGLAESAVLVAFLVGFVIFGALGVILARPYLIFVTAVPSGFLAGTSIMVVFQVSNPGIGVFFGLLLAVAGFVFQWQTTKNMPSKPTQSTKTTDSNVTYAFKYVNRNAVYISVGLMLLYVFWSGAMALAILIFLVGAIHKVPKGPDKKPLNCEQFMTSEELSNVYVFKKPRLKYVLIGIVLIIISMRISAIASYGWFARRYLYPIVQNVGICFVVLSFIYKAGNSKMPDSEAASTLPTDPSAPEVDDTPGNVNDVQTSNNVDILDNKSVGPGPNPTAAPNTNTPSIDLDKLFTGAKTSIDKGVDSLKNAKIADSLKDIKLSDYQLSFTSPQIPFLAGGLALILIGTVASLNVLNVFGLIAIVISFVHKVSGSDDSQSDKKE